MGLILVLLVLSAIGFVALLWFSAVKPKNKRASQHGWLAVVPLIVIFGWVVIQLVMG